MKNAMHERKRLDTRPNTCFSSPAVCDELLGLFSKDVALNDQFSASSSLSVDFEAHQARLFNTHSGPGNGGAWVPRLDQ